MLSLHKDPCCHFTHHEYPLKINTLVRPAVEKLTSWKAFINSSSSTKQQYSLWNLIFMFLQGYEYIAQPCYKVVAKLFILHKLEQDCHNVILRTQTCDFLYREPNQNTFTVLAIKVAPPIKSYYKFKKYP